MAPPKPPNVNADHRQRDRREERIPPRQLADPVEEPVARLASGPATSSEAITVNAVMKLGNRIA